MPRSPPSRSPKKSWLAQMTMRELPREGESLSTGVSEGVLDHLCRNPRCVNPEHLEFVPAATNVHRGNLAKLTAEQIEAIKARLREVESMRVIAADYGVH